MDRRTPENMPVDMRRVWFRGYYQAIDDFGIWGQGVQRIGCLETPIKEVANKTWHVLFPKCECEKPLEECPGCMVDDG